MSRFQHFASDNTPDESKERLDKIESKYGFVPNLIEGIAPSPQLLRGYMELSESFETSSLSPEEQQVVLLTASRLNECEYCTSVHSMRAEKAGIAWDAIEKIRHREPVGDDRMEALRTFTERIVAHVGTVPQDAWTEFLEAGFSQRNALDVIVGVTLKTLTNTTNHLIETPLDDQFRKRAWSADDRRDARDQASTTERTATADQNPDAVKSGVATA